MLRNGFNDFAFEHRSGCCATEPGYAGDIGAIEIWLIDWLKSPFMSDTTSFSETNSRLYHASSNGASRDMICVQRYRDKQGIIKHKYQFHCSFVPTQHVVNILHFTYQQGRVLSMLVAKFLPWPFSWNFGNEQGHLVIDACLWSLGNILVLHLSIIAPGIMMPGARVWYAACCPDIVYQSLGLWKGSFGPFQGVFFLNKKYINQQFLS